MESSESKVDANSQLTQNVITEVSKFKRKSDGSKLFKRNSKRSASEFASNHQANIMGEDIYGSKDQTSRGKESLHAPKLRRMFGSEKLLKQHSKRNYSEMFGDSTFTENENRIAHDSVDPSDVEKSIFERSTFQDFSYKKYKEIFKNQIKICQSITKEVDIKGERKLKRIKEMLIEKKISNKSFENEKKGIERWIDRKKKAIKEKKKNFIQILGNIHKETAELQNLRKIIQSPDDSKAANKNITSMLLDTSINSVGFSKIEAFDYNFDKHATPIREIESLSRSKLNDLQGQGNNNYSLLNSGSKMWKSAHRTHENNMSINSSK